MAKAEATIEELVSMIERGELQLPEMQRQSAWQSRLDEISACDRYCLGERQGSSSASMSPNHQSVET